MISGVPRTIETNIAAEPRATGLMDNRPSVRVAARGRANANAATAIRTTRGVSDKRKPVHCSIKGTSSPIRSSNTNITVRSTNRVSHSRTGSGIRLTVKLNRSSKLIRIETRLRGSLDASELLSESRSISSGFDFTYRLPSAASSMLTRGIKQLPAGWGESVWLRSIPTVPLHGYLGQRSVRMHLTDNAINFVSKSSGVVWR